MNAIYKVQKRTPIVNFDYNKLRKAIRNLIIISRIKALKIRDAYNLRPNYIFIALTSNNHIHDIYIHKTNDTIELMSYVMASIVEIAAEKRSDSLKNIINDFFQSNICEDICDIRTGYLELSPNYLYALYNGDVHISELL